MKMCVLVSNPGMHPELAWLAAELARRNQLHSYHTSLSWARDELVGSLIDGSDGRDSSFARLERRLLPIGLSARKVHRHASVLEVFARTMEYRSSGMAARIRSLRSEYYDQSLKRDMKRAPRPDLVVVQGGAANVRTLRMARLLGIPTMLNCPLPHFEWMEAYLVKEAKENPMWAPTLQNVSYPGRRRIRARAELDLAEYLITASKFTASTYIEMGFQSERVLSVPLGVEAALSAPKRDCSRRGLEILFVGQVTQRKGISYLLDAFAIAKLPVESRLVFAGKPVGPVIRLAPKVPNIAFIGPVTRAQLAARLACADVLVLPSLADGFGLVVLEAMAAGVPAIVSANSLGGDVVINGKNGFVVPARDALAIAERLEEMARNPDLGSSLSRGAYETASRYSWRRYALTLADEFPTR